MRQLAEEKAQPDKKVTASCAAPVDLPDRALSAGEVERFWGEDRANLVQCSAMHEAVLTFYQMRDSGLARKKLTLRRPGRGR